MTKADTIKTAGRTVLLLILLCLPIRAFGAENRNLAAIDALLGSSHLSKSEQADVRTKADAAIQGGVPGDDVEIVVSRAVKRGADGPAIAGLLDAGLSTKQQGLPAAPVLDRIEQGLSKGVPLERIVAASRQLSEKLAVAQPIVDDLLRSGVKHGRTNEREAAITAAARALEKSISVEDVKGMAAAVRERKGTLPLFTSAANTAAYLAGSGMSVQTSSRLVRNAVGKGYSEKDLDGMVRQIAEEMHRGSRPEDAASRMERGNRAGGGGMEQRTGSGRGMGSPGGPGSGAGSMGGMGRGR